MMEQRRFAEHKALQLIRIGKEAEAVELLQGFINDCSEETLTMAERLERLLYETTKAVPPYKDLREEHLNSLNKDAGIEI